MAPALALWLLALAGCHGSAPFTRDALPALPAGDGRAMVADFGRSLPARGLSEDTVIIQAPFRDDLALLSVTRLDRDRGTLELLGMNHVGLKLFHLAHDGQQPIIRFAVPPLLEQEQVLLAIAQDTRRIYFDLLPAPGAALSRTDSTLTFTSTLPDGRLIHIYGDSPLRLLEKRRLGRGLLPATRWRVTYHSPAETVGWTDAHAADASGEVGRAASGEASGGGGGGVVLENGRYRYRIIVRNRSWQTR